MIWDYFKGFSAPSENKLIVVIYTESWNLVTDYTFEKDLVSIDCYECGMDGTFDDGYIEHDGEAYCEDCKEDL